jgi:Cu-processing system permease protein
MVSSVLLGCAFLSIAVMVSVFAADRTRASGMAIAMWFFFVLIFDLLVLGVLVVTAGQWGGEALPYVLLLNPADVFRILNIFALEDVRTLYGLSTVFPPALAQPWLLGGVMAAWIALPLGIAAWRFHR